MIGSVGSTPNMPVRRPQAAPQPTVSAGGGDMRVNEHGDVVVTKDVLGFLPVTTTLEIEDILAGKYGRDFRLDFTDAAHARLRGNAQYGIFQVPVDSELDVYTGGALNHMALHVNNDRTLQVQGEFNLFGWKLPFNVNAMPTQVGPGVFHFTFNSFQLGSRGMQLPVAFAAWTLSFCVNLFSRFDGVKAVDFERLQVDFRRLNQAMQPEPRPQPTRRGGFERTA